MTDTITVTGYVATDPEHKRTPAGVAITTFRVASGQRKFDKGTSSWVDSGTNWYTVSTYRRLAEHTFRSLHKRDRVVLTGRLRLKEWDTGAKKGISVEIDADSIGHDLLFGTTTFEKDAASSAPASQGETGTDWPAAEPADQWAVLDTSDIPEPALVGAGADEEPRPEDAEDTPF